MSPLVQGKIQVLPDEVSCRIAAGEVVERPASVVKELLDNSLDAGSTLITVEVEEGGRRLIRVIDNGEGMGRSDAQLACHRFATSKLRHEEDLHRLTTLGFRGEALPSIASISRFRLRTIPPGEPVGTDTSSMGGITWETHDYAGTQGTEVEVRDVFFNTPGRLKFLKSIPTEFSKICYVVQQAAMVTPSVHFRLFHQGNNVFDYPAVSSMPDRLLQIYGPKFLERYLPIAQQGEDFHFTGFIVSPHFARATRNPQEIFVNRRAIKNSTISHAIQEGYSSFLPKGRQPQYLLFFTLNPDTVDINVHPTKREVRFSKPEGLHSSIRRAIKAVFSATGSEVAFPRSMEDSKPASTSSSLEARPSPPFAPPACESRAPAPRNTLPLSSPSLYVQEPFSTYMALEPSRSIYPLGQIHHTYLLGQIDQDLFIIDQHTAHERVLFERLLRKWSHQDMVPQGLLIPEPLELPPHQQALLHEWIPTLTQVGLEIEPFGNTTYVVRSLPAILGAISVGPLIMELLEELSECHSQDALENTLHPIFATMACQSAVQAGREMALPEIHTLLQDWAAEGFPMTCPHGRRVAIRHSLDELQTLFSRPT